MPSSVVGLSVLQQIGTLSLPCTAMSIVVYSQILLR